MAEPLPVVLIVEDDPQMQRFLRTALTQHRYRPVEALTAREALVQQAGHHPDVILLDLGLPDGDGTDVARRIRAESRTPIIVLSARGQEGDKVMALDAGADDYLTKPFGIEELLARLRVALRHAARPEGTDAEPVVEFGEIRIDLDKRDVRRGRESVHLTPTEYRVLSTLARHPGRVMTHRQLVQEVWGHAGDQTHSLRVHMTQLRHKLEKDPTRPRYLTTEIGVGYRFQVD